MELSFAAISPYLMAVGLIATFCYGFMSALRRIPGLDKSPSFQAWLPILPTVLGGVLGACLPFLYPPATVPSMRAFIGALAGMFMGVIFATFRRQIRLYVKKAAGKDAEALLAPIDESGNSLPPDGSVTRENRDTVK